MPIPASPPIIDVSARVKRPIPAPTILWPSAIGYGNTKLGKSDSSQFPSWQAIKARRSAELAEPLTAFVHAARNAQDRILVLDDYLFKPEKNKAPQTRLDQLLSWFPINLVANDVRLLTNSIGSPVDQANIDKQLSARANTINTSNRYRPGRLVIELRFTLGTTFPYIHDRFAIIDDELWHFGATVGGTHHKVNAASRGWDVDDNDALNFFEMAWEGERNKGRRGTRA